MKELNWLSRNTDLLTMNRQKSELFVRFVCAENHRTADAEAGMFYAIEKLDLTDAKGSVQRAFDEAWYWFSPQGKGGLYRPRMKGKARNQAVRRSLFWFRAEAKFFDSRGGLVVDRARQLADVVTSAGVEIREIQTRDIGELVWEDKFQVLALPTMPVPRVF